MKAVVQRVKAAQLKVGGKLISKIKTGLAVYLGVEKGDGSAAADYIAKKIANMRIFEDENGKMNRSVLDISGEVLLISQFTLCADTSGGNRPSFIFAEEPSKANELYIYTQKRIETYGITVKIGVFGGDMQIIQHNDGPVTICLVDKKQ